MFIFPCLSRSGNSGANGTRIALPRIYVDEATADGLRKLAAEQRMPFSEFSRKLFEIRVHGIDGAQSIAAAQILRVAGTGTGKGTVN
jgi:hypothetical protein